MNQHDVSFGDIQAAMQAGVPAGSPAEVHGVLAGMLCMDVGLDCRQWLGNFFGPELSGIGEHDRSCLERLFSQTRRQLADFDFSFEPLLPGDDQPLEGRASALSEWCHGFLQGIGYRGGNAGWPGECAEILRDFLEIVRLDAEVAGEGDENAYAELTEYVRVGVQVIQQELVSNTSTLRH